MTTPALPNSFTSANTIFATAINSNYTTWLSILVDGTYTHTVGAFNATTATISGNATIGSGVSQFVEFNGAFNTHLFGSGTNLGSITYPVGAAYVDYNTTHAGTVYFNAGTSQYIQATSGGTGLNYVGFTHIDLNTCTVSSVASISVSNITISTDLTVSGSVIGQRVNYGYFGGDGHTSGTSEIYYVGNGQVDLRQGHVVIHTGSIGNIAMYAGITPFTSSGNIVYKLRKNNSDIYTIGTFVVSNVSSVFSANISLTRNSYTVATSDTLEVIGDYGGVGTFTDVKVNCIIELYEDS